MCPPCRYRLCTHFAHQEQGSRRRGGDGVAPETLGESFAEDASCSPERSLFYDSEEMPRGDLLGSLEHVVLLAVVHLKDEAYGMTVRREIEDRTGRSLSIGAVYATLERLEGKGLVSSYTGEPTPERGGRAKRHFRVEAEGLRALRASQEAIRKMSAGLKPRLEAP